MSPSSLAPPRPCRPPAITVHCIEHAQLALASGRPVTLISAPAAGVFAGPAWWRALVAACGTSQPDLLDCADAPGRALEALAVGCSGIILLPCPAWPNVAERATMAGALLRPDRPVCLDLADPAAPRRIDAWLEVG